ncbi:MAG TPA: PAS domain-containing protein, partial [Coxiellaceae bacterium]|nr:PAS domain-containing protein [Coxiellaceae bacterium]
MMDNKSNNYFNAQFTALSTHTFPSELYSDKDLNVQALLSKFKQLRHEPNQAELDVNLILDLAIRAMGSLLKENERSQSLPAKKSEFDFLHVLPVAAYAWDLENKIIDCNEAASRLFGYKISDMVERNILETLVPAENQHYILEKLEDLAHYPHGLFNQNENITADGRRIVCDWLNFPLFDKEGKCNAYMALAVHNMEKGDSVEELFQQAETRWRSYWENIPDGIAEIDLNGKI